MKASFNMHNFFSLTELGFKEPTDDTELQLDFLKARVVKEQQIKESFEA
jgi:hypothetical protein